MLLFVLCLIILHAFHVEATHVPVCPEIDGSFPEYFTHHEDCSKFWQCSNGKLLLHECPEGLHYNSVLNVCDWPERVDCTAARNDTDEEAGKNTCIRHGIECPKVDGVHPVYEALPYCTKFCQCSNGKPYLHDCPPGLHFNFASNLCDWPNKAGCTPVKNNTYEDPGNEICLQHGIECPRVDGVHPVFGALPDCTKFCQCSNGIPYLYDCPDGLHFNSASNVCDCPKKAGCASVNNDTDQDPGNNICLRHGIECPRVDGVHPVFGALPDCTKFCQCSNGIPYLHDCPDGLHFNSASNVCDWPKKAGCTPLNNDTDEDPGNNICLRHGIECPRVDGVHPVFGALPDCTKFCQCSNGIPYLHDCPDGLHFNSASNVCDWPKKAGCTPLNNDTDEDPGNNICLRHGIECPRVDGVHPVFGALPDCTKFCQCSNGIPYLYDCPDGLHFNSALNVCDWPKKAECIAA